MIRQLFGGPLSALTLRTFTFAVALFLLSACDQSGTDVVEQYHKLPGQVSLRAIGRSESICLVSEDGPLIGDPLSNATVTAIDNSGAHDNMITATDASGEARFDLLTGAYDIVVEAEGYEPITVEGVFVLPDSDMPLGDIGLWKVEDYFPNGVAAGDVDQSSVVLWARAESPGTIRFEYGQDPTFLAPPDGVRDKVVDDANIPAKVDDIFELDAGTQYYYRACRGDRCQASQLPGCEARGKFHTPYAGGHHGLTFGVSSCARADLKPFVSIRNVPDEDLDFFVALGDTVYADTVATGGPVNTVEAFREQNQKGYSQWESPADNFFALARGSTAFYVNIDDHEIVNNFAGGALPNSQKEYIGDVARDCADSSVCFCPEPDPNGNCNRPFINETDLFEAGLQAWYDYNPVRKNVYGNTGDRRTAGKDKLYRYRTFGKDAALFMLDARSFRDKAINIGPQDIVTFEAQAYDKDRTMLGSAQLSDLLEDLNKAQADGITWKFVLVPEPIQNLGNALAADRFEGYAHERAVILDHIESFCIANVVFISGDIHGTITNNLIYRTHLTGLDRYSATWDISTGPVAYSLPFGPKSIESDPRKNKEDLDNYEALDPDSQNDQIKESLNKLLIAGGNPTIGLGSELSISGLLQRENAYPFPHATRLGGRFDVTNTYGWTEFDIDEVTQILTVTTWGIPYYKQGADQNTYLGLEPRVVGKFEIPPVDQAADGGACEIDKNCSSCRCSLLDGIGEEGLGQCKAREPEGSSCASDGECISGRCTTIGPGFAECRDKAPDGGDCRNDIDCESDNCSVLLCRPSPNESNCGDDGISLCVCTSDNQCASGRCSGIGDGGTRCQAKLGNTAHCREDSDCRSDRCSGFECKAKKTAGESCLWDHECHSDKCSGIPLFKECE